MVKVIILLILTIFSFKSYSQEESNITSAGKEFIFAFPPNYHTFMNYNNEDVQKSDSLYVFIAATEPTSGYIEANDIFGNSRTFTFNITDPSQVYKFAQSFWDFEMISYKFVSNYDRFDDDWSNPLRNTDHNEKVTKMSWKLVADKDVNVTILNQALKSSDATLLYPVNSLGKNYIVATYYSDRATSAGDTPSQFVIIASEDNTKITINPSNRTFKNSTNIQNITLNKGETYLVQSAIGDNIDLTGTEVLADKDIAIIGSQMRATVPINKSGQSRDYLIEQNLPISVWGQSAFSIPFVQIPQAFLTSLDLTRIIVANDNTEISINGVKDRTLNKGQFYDIETDSPMYISSNNKISVIQYKKSQRSSNFESNVGDPFMMVIPPFEQFLDKYKIISPNTQEIRTDQNNTPVLDGAGKPRKNTVFSEHYVNVVIKNEFKNTLKINNAFTANLKWASVPSTDFVYTQIRVNEGTNYITADSPFGIYSYGYGDANSYGYVGGLGLASYDEDEPEITEISECFEAKGSITDSLRDDTGIASIIEQDNSNTDLAFNFVKDSSVVDFNIKLKDIHLDGKITIIARDKSKLESKKLIEIPGFTVYINQTNSKVNSNAKAPAKGIFCKSYELENYGKFNQIINELEFLSDSITYTTDLTLPYTLKPNEKKTFNICFNANGLDGEYEVGISLVTPCIKEERINQIVEIRPDNKEPELAINSNDCDRDISIQITESDVFDYGIKSINIIDSTNIKVNYKSFNAYNLNLNIKVIDPYKDSFISLEIEDSAGHKSTFEKVIPGHTLSFGSEQKRDVKIDLGNVIKSSKNSILLPIYNYGKYPITYNNFTLKNNYNFSIPLSQFPLTIMPNDSNYIEIYMLSNDLGDLEVDTLILDVLCIETEIPMDAFVTREISETNAKCDLKVIIKEKVDFDGFGEVFPNPVKDKINVEFSSVYDSNLKYFIINNLGNIVETNIIAINQGFFVIQIDVASLPNGTYTIVFELEGNRTTRKFIISK